MELTLLQDIIVVLLVSIPLVLLCTKFKLSPLVGFMITGILIGPYGLKLIQNPDHIELLAEIGVVLLLFAVGLEFSLQELVRLNRLVLFGGTLQVFLTLFAIFGLGQLLGWTPYQSLYVGAAVALSSTALVLASLSHHKALDSQVGRTATGILIFQDFMVIPFLAFLPLMMGPLGSTSEEALNTVLTAFGKMALIFAVALFLHYFLLAPLWRAVVKSRSRELFIVTVLGLAMGLSWFTNFLGLSYALGAFLGGLLLSATEYRFYALSEVLPFRHGFSALFFASIGMLFSVTFFVDNLGLMLMLVISIPLIKVIITTVSVRLLKYSLSIALPTGLLIGQIGEFSYLLALQGNKLGVFSNYFYQIIISFTVVTLLVTPIVAPLALKGPEIINRLFKRGRKEDIKIVSESSEKKEYGHIILCGFGTFGQTLASILEREKIPCQIIEMNPRTFEQLKQRKVPVQLGDGSSDTILLRAGIESARAVAIAIPDYMNAASIVQRARELNKELFIVVRARTKQQGDHLYAAGADVVICEELEGGIEMGRYLLKSLGRKDEELQKLIQSIRDFGSADFF